MQNAGTKCPIYDARLLNAVVDEDHLALDTIMRVGCGGNYLGEDHTFNHMRDLRIPSISSRKAYYSDRKIPGTAETAGKYYREVLDSYEEPALDPKIVAELLRYIDGIK